nr:hypothetical protein [Tanacetum cinerariifolium]
MYVDQYERSVCPAGKGQGHMGRLGRSFWNSSRVLQVHRKGEWGGLVLAGKLGKWVLFGRLGYWGLAGLVLQVLNSYYSGLGYLRFEEMASLVLTGFSPSGDFGKFTLLVPGLCLLPFEGLGFDLLAR